MLKPSAVASTSARTAQAPAVWAKRRGAGRKSKAVGEAVVVPMTWRNWRPGSSGFGNLVGERGEVFLWKGELEGVSRRAWWFILGCAVFDCARAIEDSASSAASPSLLGGEHVNGV